MVSFGADIHERDTVGDFRISEEGIGKAGRKIAGLGLPAVIVQEGGYNSITSACGGISRPIPVTFAGHHFPRQLSRQFPCWVISSLRTTLTCINNTIATTYG